MTDQTQPKREREILFAQAVISLSGGNPHAWGVFMSHLAERLEGNRHACVHSSGDQTRIFQGRAQEGEQLFRDIEGSRKLLDELHAKGMLK